MTKKANSVGYALHGILDGLQSGYEKLRMLHLQKSIPRLPQPTPNRKSVLFDGLSSKLVKNPARPQQGAEKKARMDREAEKKSRSTHGASARKVEGRKASRQGWLHLNMDADTFEFRLSRIHPRASLSDGATLRQNIRPLGSGTSQGPKQAKQLNKEFGVTQ